MLVPLTHKPTEWCFNDSFVCQPINLCMSARGIYYLFFFKAAVSLKSGMNKTVLSCHSFL